ncbi:MAG: asparagine synthase [Planctomycetota bacterium]|nr:MAG: asparagine synthase [Planctomycetota bacterium]
MDESGFSSLLESAVESRLDADVPLGTFLSGGLDSALITAIARKHRPDIRAYTVRMPEAAFDESASAERSAAAIGCRHIVLDCDPSPASDLVALIEQLGLPFGDSSLLPTYWVSKSASKEIRVALSGDGGDELFGGYQRHEISRVLAAHRSLLSWIPRMLLPSRDPRSRFSKLRRLTDAARCEGYDDLLSLFPQADLRHLVVACDGPLPPEDRFWPQDDPLRRDFGRYLPSDILRKTDTASMSVPLEVRAPLLSRRMVSACLCTPLSTLMPNGQRKGLLRALARRHLPPEIVDRPKMGFAIPIGEWFRTDYGGMRQLLYDHLESADPFPGLADAGVEINMDFVRRMLREHDAAGERSINPWHGRDHSQRLYMLVVLSIWCKWLTTLTEPRA